MFAIVGLVLVVYLAVVRPDIKPAREPGVALRPIDGRAALSGEEY